MPTSRSPGPAFEAGPYAWLPAVLPIGNAIHHRVWGLALLAAVLGWLPLLLLSSVEGLVLSANPHESFLTDLSSYGRYAIASPAFVLAGAVYVPYLTSAVRQLVETGIVADGDLPAYQRLVESTRTLLASDIAENVLLDGRPLIAYKYAIGVQVVSTLMFFGGPMLLLMKPLTTLKARGTLDYGRLASEVGHQFERK